MFIVEPKSSYPCPLAFTLFSKGVCASTPPCIYTNKYVFTLKKSVIILFCDFFCLWRSYQVLWNLEEKRQFGSIYQLAY